MTITCIIFITPRPLRPLRSSKKTKTRSAGKCPLAKPLGHVPCCIATYPQPSCTPSFLRGELLDRRFGELQLHVLLELDEFRLSQVRLVEVAFEGEGEEHVGELDDATLGVDLELLGECSGVGLVAIAHDAERRRYLHDELGQARRRERVARLGVELRPRVHEAIDVGWRDEVRVLLRERREVVENDGDHQVEEDQGADE
ncbi:MAG: hypothetical protein ACK559_35240, partial [bacterium]